MQILQQCLTVHGFVNFAVDAALLVYTKQTSSTQAVYIPSFSLHASAYTDHQLLPWHLFS